MLALLQGQTSLLTQTPLNEEGRLLPNDCVHRRATHPGELRSVLEPDGFACWGKFRRVSCFILVQFSALVKKCTKILHFLQERALWKH